MNQLTFPDIFKKGFVNLSGGFERFTSLDVVLNILVSFAIGMFIFYIYRKTFRGVLYQKSFNITLVIVCTITTLIIMTISGNLVLSLGMVGALSIVRFRTPIKDPIDLAFLFWAITVGIANGVNYFNISIIGSVFVSIIILWLTKKEETDNPYLLVLEMSAHANDDDINKLISSSVSRIKLKSKSINPAFAELTFEVRLKDGDTGFLKTLRDEMKVTKATLISYSGDLASV